MLLFLNFCPLSSNNRKMGNDERTFIMIKPDGVQRGLMGDIIKRFEQKGFRLVAMKFVQVRGPCGPEEQSLPSFLMTLI